MSDEVKQSVVTRPNLDKWAAKWITAIGKAVEKSVWSPGDPEIRIEISGGEGEGPLRLKVTNLRSTGQHIAPPGQEYVDPYLFETGHFESREEYEELSRTAKIKPRTRA